jgi:hypothetical protein
MGISKNKKISLIIIVFMILSSSSHSKPVSEYFNNIEPLLIEKNYDEANKEFENLSLKFKRHSIKNGSIKYLYENTVKWLKRRENIILYLHSALKDINSDHVYKKAVTNKLCSGYCVRYSVSSIDSYLPKHY